MITATLYGGIGNQLFGIAATIGTALRNNDSYCIPIEVQNPHYEGQKVFYSPNLNYCHPGTITATVYREPHFHYAPIPKPTSNNTLLIGYWQSEKYFAEYRNEILRTFNFQWGICEGLVSVHVRRGDYLKYPTMHPVITKEYLEKAMATFPDKEFVFFSDDIKWCKENFGHRKDCGFENSIDEIADLTNASCCEHNIGSNSSFSWWIYYLNQNPNKIGVFPQKSKWFGESLPHNVDDLYLPEWILI